jgi:hypothetical protein
MRRFIAHRHGLPVLQGLNGAEGMISIRDTEALLEGMIQIMQQRHIQGNVHRAPPLVDNLIHLLQKLGDASGWLGIPMQSNLLAENNYPRVRPQLVPPILTSVT